ncbi:uncharacterized protein LOC120616404 [Pteropus medius]|uniref:disco-interacting protein 2 homolog A n=1 Tax=Pteropus vampyrus TaxID=132908 RepID=UPI00196AD8CA|nr:disco-interacting protein 2 homolog A [Pteropus giganteus]
MADRGCPLEAVPLPAEVRESLAELELELSEGRRQPETGVLRVLAELQRPCPCELETHLSEWVVPAPRGNDPPVLHRSAPPSP